MGPVVEGRVTRKSEMKTSVYSEPLPVTVSPASSPGHPSLRTDDVSYHDNHNSRVYDNQDTLVASKVDKRSTLTQPTTIRFYEW